MGFERRKKWFERAMTFLGLLGDKPQAAKEYAKKWDCLPFQRAISAAIKIKKAQNIARAKGKKMFGGKDAAL